MTSRITIIEGHPDPHNEHFCYALANAYAKGAEKDKHECKRIKVATMEFPLLRTKRDFENNKPPTSIQESQDAIAWANHLVILYPLWLGAMPALLKGFFEQVFRPGFSMSQTTDKMPEGLLKGKSARIVVTMGMPAFFYRWYFFSHSLKNLKRNILAFSGISPVRTSLIGNVESTNDTQRKKWIEKMYRFGQRGH